jgi:DNA-binding LytR/AlgR family response regulator
VRIVVEAKDRAISGRAMRDEISEAKRNRDAAVGLVVFSTAHAPAGIAPFDVRMGDVYCAIDPADPQPATLDAALRLARLLALAATHDTDGAVDADAIHDALERVRAELDSVRSLKMKLTTIGTAAKAVNAGLDQLRDGIVARIAEAEVELRLDRGSDS